MRTVRPDIIHSRVSTGQLIGIKLTPDSFVPTFQHSFELARVGNIITTVYSSVVNTSCADLRRYINKAPEVPKEFRFLNKAGWPFDIKLEDKIGIEDCLINGAVLIQKHYQNHIRIGVKLTNDKILGFVFLNLELDISHIRSVITSELSDHFTDDESFEFIDNNSWPVRKAQENRLSMWDLVCNNCITIEKKHVKRSTEINDTSHKRLKTFQKHDLEKLESSKMVNSVLISYVHGEASGYARNLKEELLKLGFKYVFLDVDDIPVGQDWQDVISLAVHKCSIFIPLVTPRYGETRWTNREAKLADDKEKTIIPVSFLNKWPPDPLALQFLTLQYIPSSITDDHMSEISSELNNPFSHKSVQRVASEIQRRCYGSSTTDGIICIDDTDDTDDTDNSQETPDHLTLDFSAKREECLKKKKADFIVISAHCKQKDFVEKLAERLKNGGYEVWHSIDMCECDENSFSPLEDSQPVIDSPVIESNGFCIPHSSFDKSNPESTSNVHLLKTTFKTRVKEAKAVVLIFSEEYLESRLCKQQLFYCEQRKTAIVVKYGDFQINSMILNLYPEHEMISSKDLDAIIFKIRGKLVFDSEDSYRNNIMLSISKLGNVVNTNVTVYVIGGTKDISKNAQAFSMVLGTELAKVSKLCLATEGFTGAGDLVGRNFCEEQHILDKGMQPNVYHILPVKDSSDYSEKAVQNADGHFEKLPYGNTLFYGMSVSNRDDIVAAAFKICILVEGGERSACLAEKFLWNDCTVIPVLYKNTRVKYKQCLMQSINKVPNGINENDWHNLNNQHCSPEDRAKAVKRIVCNLLSLET